MLEFQVKKVAYKPLIDTIVKWIRELETHPVQENMTPTEALAAMDELLSWDDENVQNNRPYFFAGSSVPDRSDSFAILKQIRTVWPVLHEALTALSTSEKSGKSVDRQWVANLGLELAKLDNANLFFFPGLHFVMALAHGSNDHNLACFLDELRRQATAAFVSIVHPDTASGVYKDSDALGRTYLGWWSE